MTQVEIQKNKEEYINTFKSIIKREGSEELLNYLISSDFFVAPASTKFHSAFEGGLCFHSLNVYKRFRKNLIKEYGENFTDHISEESVAIISLLHDICKVDSYKVDYRNVKVDGEWTRQPYFAFNDQLPYGHGEKSVYMISGFMRLSREEAMAINWHMGGFDARVLGGSHSISTAFYSYPTSVLFHISDIEATYLDETCPN